MGMFWLGMFLIFCFLNPSTQEEQFHFTRSFYNVTIPENSMGQVHVTPQDKMGIYRNADVDVKYKIVSGDPDKFFKAEERLVGDFWFLLLRTRSGNSHVLNRERKDKYTLEIKATVYRRDKKEILGEVVAVVYVLVLDTNDLKPLFYSSEYVETIPEDTPLHKSIMKVYAEDADLGQNGEIYYSFKEMSEQFAIHPVSGVITPTRPLIYTEKSIHELKVIAHDRGTVFKGGGTPSIVAVKILVQQVNLHGPEIYVHHLPDIIEHSNTDIYAIVRVIDRDVGTNGEIQSLDIVDGDPDGHFRVRSTKGVGGAKGSEYNIEVLKLLDRATAPLGYNLTLRAIDKGVPPRQTYTSIPIHLVFLNDNAPVFDREIYEVDISETAPINTPIIRLKVTDADQGMNAQVFLEIVGGNEGGEFYINPDTGMLYTLVCLDAEVKNLYTLTVSAVDQGNIGTRKQSSAKVKIQVLDVNDNNPLFDLDKLEAVISENEPAGTSVVKVTARDKDSGENAYISYSISNINPAPFDIDHFTGIIRTTKVLDYESMRREYILHVRASDWGLPFRRQTELKVKIKLRDINDNKPQFEKIDCFGLLPRSVPIGTEIVTLSAIDFDVGNLISYSIASGNDDNCFSIDMSAGVLTVSCDLSTVVASERDIGVTATDGMYVSNVTKVKVKLIHSKRPTDFLIKGERGSFDCKDTGTAQRLTELLSLAEKNSIYKYNEKQDFAMMPSRYGDNTHTPEFMYFPSEISVNESTLIGSTLMKIRAQDRDLGYNGKLIFGISSGDHDSVFRLEPETGELHIIGYLDREREREYNLNLTVYDQGRPQKSTSRNLIVNVLDVNDKKPKFDKALYSFKISENVHNGTAIIRVHATDEDLDENANIGYSLATETSEFRIDRVTGTLYIASTLDRENKDLYELKIRATDRASNPKDPDSLFSEALVRIIVDDVNDNAPVFKMKTYTVKVREDIPFGSVVAILDASDPDLGKGGEIRYSIINGSDLFVIDNQTGTVRIIKALDYEDRQIHTIGVTAEDLGSPTLMSNVTLIVEVVDVNENIFAPQFDDFVIATAVLENQPIGTLVTVVEASDSDPPGEDSRIGYIISGGDGLGYFSINNQGNVRTEAVLDTETKTHYWLTVYAHDHGVVPLYTRLEMFISITNVNDNVPLCDEPVYYPHVTENSPSNTHILQVTAQDADLDSNQTLSFSITSGNLYKYFNIDKFTGVISTTGNKLDREVQAEHILEISVSDNGIPPLTSVTQVVIIVDDENDNAPQFEQSFYHVIIPESPHNDLPSIQNEMESNETELDFEDYLDDELWEFFNLDNLTGTPVFRVLAVDKDVGRNGEIHYSVKSGRGKGKFGIHPQNGVVYAQKPLTSGQEYDLLVKATDNGSPNKSTTARVSIQVLPVVQTSEHSPVIKSTNQRVEVTESDSVGYLVALIQATDIDSDLLWYKILDGDPRSEFVMGGDAGSVLLAKQLDWETQKEYNLTISVTDGVHTAYTQLFVSVIDINEHRPWFSQPVYTVNVSESTPVMTELVRLDAVDIDQDNKVVYTIHSSRNQISLDLFQIDYQTGAVILAQPLDRECLSEHVLTIVVKDHGTPAKRNYARVVVHVHDANDHTPEWSGSIVQGLVLENSVKGSAVLTVLASDKDHGLNAAITYSIISGNVGNTFSLHPTLGVLSLDRELDISVTSEYMLIVKAMDSGSPSRSSTLPVHIMVVMSDNAQPKFPHKEVAAEVYEGEPPGSLVVHMEARSVSSLLYEIITGNTGNMFNINPSTGTLVTAKVLDYEVVKVYNLTISATNMARKKSTCYVVVHVLDRNDNAPQFLETKYFGVVYEDVAIGTLILTNENTPLVISAQDADSEVNSLLHFYIIEPSAQRHFQINPVTGAVRTTSTLNYETMPSLSFSVRVADAGVPQLSSDLNAEVIIKVLDVNDCAPVFLKSEYNVSVLLPTFSGVVVVQVSAKDADSAKLTSLQYSILSGNIENVYSINSENGVISVKDTLRGIISAPHRLKVAVTDGRYSASAYVNIRWEHSSDSGLKFQNTFYQGAVLENSTKLLTVTVVNVVGNRLNEHLTFSILNPSPYFQIGKTSGAISTTGIRFDREAEDHYQLIVQVCSEPYGGIVRVSQVPVNITVLDVNDNCPVFINLPYFAIVSMDAVKGDVITKVHAIDLDFGENGEVRYELIRGHGELFRVCRKTGEISLKQSLEGHKKNFQLGIAAYDGGMTPCSTEVMVHVTVVDQSMPVFEKQFYSVKVPENFPIHTALPVGIKANSPRSKKIFYSIVKGDDLDQFDISYNTGVMSIAGELDFEAIQQYFLTIRATDVISGSFSDVYLQVEVSDVNDCHPHFPVNVYNTSLSEATPVGTFVLKVEATDNDTGLNGIVYYSILPNDVSKSDHFNINSKSGELYLKNVLDRELQDIHLITVVAADSVVPSLTTSVNVWIEVLDLNDNPPRFDKDVYTVWLSEEVNKDQFVTVISAIDKDIGHQQYSFFSGNQHHVFSIATATGVVTVVNTHKLREKSTHVLNVSVTDGVHTSYCQLNVEIVGTNRNSPVFEKHQYDAMVSENMPVGTLLLRVTATDSDSDKYAKVVYSISSEILMDKFYINNITGEIRTKQLLDREQDAVYDIPLLATDGGGKTGISTVRLVVMDANDNPPQFLLQEYKACIFSNLTLNSAFLKVRAQDKDEGLGAQIEYAIYDRDSSKARNLFGIHQHTGAIILLQSALSYENQVFQFFVRASDCGKPSLHEDVPIEIYIMANDDNPPLFQHSDQTFFIPEDIEIGAVITQVKLVSEITVNYKLVSRDNSLFDIDSEGRIRVSKHLDRENVSLHNLGVLALTDTSPPLMAVAEIYLHVLDVNDNPPMFGCAKYTSVIPESVMEGTSVLKVLASDTDESNNGEVHYSLIGDDESFTIDSFTGWITTVKYLDRETTPFYTLTIVAKDNGVPSLSATALLHISIADCNDNPPNFTQQSYYATVQEDALLGSVVIHLAVIDLDIEPTYYISYYISDGDPLSYFGIRQTGEIYVARNLDREKQDSYHLTVLATDSKFVTSTLATVEILDANDEKPQCTQVRYSEVISENVAPGTYILTVLATDADLESKVKFFLTGEAAQHFYLDRDTGELKTSRLLDREQISHYSLTAHVQDGDVTDWECLSYIEIDLLDINDNPPTFYANNYTVTLAEDALVGTLVTKMHANDLDRGLNRKILYLLVDSGGNHFEIAGDTGLVRLAKPLDRETQSTYILVVKAMDQGNPQLWSVTTLRVLVLDINDNPPEFISQSYFVYVAENISLNTDITQVVATSLDAGVNAQIIYSIVDGNELQKFKINSETGIIQVCEPLDYEELQNYVLTVVATDLGEPPLSSTAIVNITVTDSNDNSPIFSESIYQTEVNEDIRIGDLVIQIQASDLDNDNNGRVCYSLESGDDHQQFSLDYNNGIVTIARPLDREMISRYTLRIMAIDFGQPQLSTTAEVNIEIMDINDNPPVFSQQNYTAIVQENKQPGWPVCQLTVTDADIFPNADPFTLQIVSGDPESKFKIESDGTLLTLTLLSCKDQDTFQLNIRAFDSGTPQLYSDAWVTVKVIEESKFVPVVIPLEVWLVMYEEHWMGGEVGRVKATDRDPYDSLVYKLVQSGYDKLFSIDSRHGSLTASSKLDAGKYVLNVSVTDGKFTAYAKVSIYVQPVWNDLLQYSISIRLNGVTPQDFVWKQWKDLQLNLTSALQQDIHLISVQAAPHGDLDVLFAVKGGIELSVLSDALEKSGLNKLEFSCGCQNGAICRQRIQLQPEIMYNIATDTRSFVAAGHSHQLYCACNLGFAGDHCEELLPPAECVCPAPQVCVPQQTPPGYLCLPSFACSNLTCHPAMTSSAYSITWEEVVGIFIAIAIIVFLVIIFIIYRRWQRIERVSTYNKSPPVLNPGIKRTSKLSNLELSQRPSRPSSYTCGTNNEVLSVTPLNNLDSLRTYGSVGDGIEHVPPDYRRNLNRNATSPQHKINNDLKRVPELSQHSLSSIEDESRNVGGYHWDCSDWVRPGQNPLPNITEVPGSEVADSASYHSNSSNETSSQPNVAVDPARDLATLDKKLYLTYNSEDDVVVYGFPSQSQTYSIDESDVPS